MNVNFFGVRGSTPCACHDLARYGGNTACVAVEVPGADPIVLDLGTGLRFWGETQPQDGTFRGTALVSHLHWDHIQGLPFFVPVLRPGARLDVYGPPSEGMGLEEAFRSFLRPPFFPVELEALHGEIVFHDVIDDTVVIGDAKVTSRSVPHVGLTAGYRIEVAGRVVTYVSDHQAPSDGSGGIADGVLELADGADLLIHDAQYTPEEFAVKADWGHCTIDYAVDVAAEAGVGTIALFHHDPAHNDARLDELTLAAADRGARRDVEVVAASEGLTVALEPAAPSLAGVGPDRGGDSDPLAAHG